MAKEEKKKSYVVTMDTWLMGQPVRAGEGDGLTEAQIEQGKAAGVVKERDTEDDADPAPNGITEPIKNQAHTAITQDSIRKIQGEVTGDADKKVAPAPEEKKK